MPGGYRPAAAIVPAPTSVLAVVATRWCPTCDAAFVDRVVTCPDCDEALLDGSPPVDERAERLARSIRRALVRGFLVLVVLGEALLAWVMWTGWDPREWQDPTDALRIRTSLILVAIGTPFVVLAALSGALAIGTLVWVASKVRPTRSDRRVPHRVGGD